VSDGGRNGGLALRLDGLSYVYPRSSAGVSGVSLLAEPGAVYGLLGQNGAGKTTLMRLTLGLLTPTAGRVLVGDRPLLADRARLLGSIGALVETPSLYLHLSGREHLRVFAAYYRVPGRAVDGALERVGLANAGGTIVKHYSLGMKQRLGLATALLHDPAVLILDEPMNGLDPGGIAELRDLLAALAAEGKTIIVSSHLLSEVEKSASRIGILHQGKLNFEGSPSDLAARARSGSGASLKVSDAADAAGMLAAAGRSCRADGDHLLVDGVGEAEIPEIVRSLVQNGHNIYDVRQRSASLEEGFLDFVREVPDAG